MAEIQQERLQLRDAGFVVGNFSVDLQAAARLQHGGFPHRLVVAQRDQRLTHARGGKSVMFAYVDGRGVM